MEELPVSAPEPMAVKTIFGNFNLNAQLPNGRGIQVAGYIFEGESRESLNDRLDLLQEVIERQRCRCEIPELEGKREQMITAMEQMREVLVDLETKKKKGLDLTSQERLNLRNMQVNIKKIAGDIEKGEAIIIETKRKAGLG